MEAGILARTLHIISTNDPTVEMALVNHKKLNIDDDDLEKENKASDLAKKSLHDLSQVSFLILYDFCAIACSGGLQCLPTLVGRQA